MRWLLALLLLAASGQAVARPSDVRLYRDVAAEVGEGASYYETVARLHRERGYPLRPFFTVRLPTLAYLIGFAGSPAMLALAYVLFAIAMAAWYRQLQGSPVASKAAFLGLFAFAGGGILTMTGIQVHDVWAGLLVSLALGLSWAPRTRIFVGLLAVLVRELALPILLLFAVLGPHRRLAFSAILIVAAAMTLHYFGVRSVLLPTDPPSQGWTGLRGPQGFADHLAQLTVLQALPGAIVFAFLPLCGWAMYSRLHFLWFGGMIAAICIFARADNLYWSALILPAYVGGIALFKLPSRVRVRPSSGGTTPRFTRI